MPKRILQFDEELRQKYTFSRKGLNDFDVKCITCGCIGTVRIEEWKNYRDFVDMEYQKIFITA